MLSLAPSATCLPRPPPLGSNSNFKRGKAFSGFGFAQLEASIYKPLTRTSNNSRAVRRGCALVVASGNYEKGIHGYSSSRGLTVEDYDFV
eukprot:scaffold51653_cov41-Prasinocladus_malaysianus.AAC.1